MSDQDMGALSGSGEPSAAVSAASGFDPARVAKRLSPVQQSILTRSIIRMGNPAILVPRYHPHVPERSWLAVAKKGLIVRGQFGYALTPEGEAVRAILSDRDGTLRRPEGAEGEACQPGPKASPTSSPEPIQ